MVLEDLDGLFGDVPSVVVGWDQLELHLVGFYGVFEFLQYFVVQNVRFWLNFAVVQPVNQ